MKMLKKATSFLLATSMLATSLFSVTAVNATPQKKYSAFQTSYINEKGERVNKIDYSSEQVYSKARSILPASYNSADHGYVTSVKNQGDTGTCWAHAATAACESSMIVNNGYDTSLDLSELHLAYAGSHTQRDKMGMFYDYDYKRTEYYLDAGNTALFILANQIGVVKESANHNQFSSEKLHFTSPETFDVYNPEALYAYNEACLSNAYEIMVANSDLLKEYIVKYGAGVMSVNSYYYSEPGVFYNYESFSSDHNVAVVGWDDNYPKENFSTVGATPKNDGAWLVKNSWGEYNGIDGYMWVSYEDLCVLENFVIFYEMSPNDTYTNAYQYDDLCDQFFLCDENDNYNFVGGAYMANMFTAVKDNETLEAVSFYTSNENLDYTVEIYTGIDGITDPTNGTLKATVSGEDLLMGYHTIELPEPLALEKGEKFSVVVNLKDNQNPQADVYINVDSDYYVAEALKVSEYGESFFSLDGESWDDIKYSFESNLRIKAFTNSDETPMELTDYYDSYDGKSREELFLEFKTTLENYVELKNDTNQYSSKSFQKLKDACDYSEQVYKNPDIFLAIEFFGLNQKLHDLYNQLEAYDINDIILIYNNYIRNNVEGYYSYPQWKEYLNTCDSIRAEVENTTLTNEELMKYKSRVEQACMDFLTSLINNGKFDSYLQNFGDADNNGDINIKDATRIQMVVGEYMTGTVDINRVYDVDDDGEVNIKDATAVQMYVSKLIYYLPVYDKQFADEEVDINISFDTAVKNLETALSKSEQIFTFEGITNKVPFEYIVLYCLQNDAKKVLANPQDYYPNVIDFKARCINYFL